MPRGGRLMIETANATLAESDIAGFAEPAAPGPYVMIAVSDTGVGMDAATRERAFDPFFTTKDVGKGPGLGLSQVHRFARQSAGYARIYSEVGEGTTIKIYLPRHVGEASIAKPNAQARVARSHREEQILVVEDDDSLRGYTRQRSCANSATACWRQAAAKPRCGRWSTTGK
jgi:hypothetical protein